MAKGAKFGGRRKGTPNKITADLRDTIQKAFKAVGGQDYLETVARDQPAVFCKLLGMTLPKDVNLNASAGLSISIAVGDAARQSVKP